MRVLFALFCCCLMFAKLTLAQAMSLEEHIDGAQRGSGGVAPSV
jgi:hypothetical protein